MVSGIGKFYRRRNRRRIQAVAAWRFALAWLALFWERLWPAIWSIVGIAGLYLVVALLDLLPFLAGWLHALILAGFAAAAGTLGWRSLRRLRLPARAAASRRLERVNRLAHRPLDTLSDTLESGTHDADARDLWTLHQARARAAVANLRVGWPAPRLIRRDPFALRIALGVSLTIALIAVDDPFDRLQRAMTPDLARMASAGPAKLDAWITPPEYTQKAPIFLVSGTVREAPDAAGPIVVPEGSMMVVRIGGGSGIPMLVAGDERREFTAQAKDSFQIEHALTESGRVSILQDDRNLGEWQVSVTPDEPPAVSFARPPSQTRRGALRLDYAAADDYGVEKVVALITRSGAVAQESALAKLDPIVIQLSLPATRARQVKSTSFNDLTPHPWAGLPVNMALTATDAAGQSGRSKTIQMVLPARVFSHPVAQAIIEQRRQLSLYPEKNRNRVSAMLEIAAWEFERYNGDKVVFLALRTAAQRLEWQKLDAPKKLSAMLQLLWDTALRVEDGTLSLSERALREVQQALQDALSKNSPDAEIERLLKEFERALNEYLKSLEEHLRAMPREWMDYLPRDERVTTMSREDLQKLLDRIRELSRSGQRDAAAQLLSQLRKMLENLRTRQFARPGAQQRRAMKMLNELQNIIRDQQKMLDDTFREAQRRGQLRGSNPNNPMSRLPPGFFPPGFDPPRDGKARRFEPMNRESASQEALRRRLGELMRQLGEGAKSIPRALGRAERFMRDSGDQLGRGQAGKAVPPQTGAIDQLQQGARAATEQLMRQLGRGRQPGGGDQPFGRSSRSRDPFGREIDKTGRSANTEGIEIPDEDTVRDARRIRDELRRRAGEHLRPRLELDYIERLLKQF